jgi:hypothetical protein
MEALDPDRFLVHLVIPGKQCSPDVTAAAKRMWALRERLIREGAASCGYGFWHQSELPPARGEFHLRAARALRARVDPLGLLNRGRTLEMRTRQDAVVDGAILKPGAMHLKGLFGGAR